MARHALAAVHDGVWPLDDGLLVASELVSIAVKHSGCVAEQSLAVRIDLGRGNLLISGHVPGRSGDAADAVGRERYGRGRLGLQLVDQIDAVRTSLTATAPCGRSLDCPGCSPRRRRA